MPTLFKQTIASIWPDVHYADPLGNAYEEWREKRLIKEFAEECMNRHTIVENELKSISNPFANGSQNKPYYCEMILPEVITECNFCGLEELGLSVTKVDRRVFIEGIPLLYGEKDIELECIYDGWVEGLPKARRVFHFSINPDPWELWKDVPPDPNLPYPKANTDSGYISIGNGRRILAASRRGRSHAQDGRYRDDDFRLHYDHSSGWSVLAVADGAGSAIFSREGSRLACIAAVDFCAKKLTEQFSSELDEVLTVWHGAYASLKQQTSSEPAFPNTTDLSDQSVNAEYSLKNAEKKAGNETSSEEVNLSAGQKEVAETDECAVEEKAASDIAETSRIKTAAYRAAYEMLVYAAHGARKFIEGVVQTQPYGQGDLKHFATTLLIAMCKRYDFGWAVLTFSIGDGAIGVVYGNKAELLCKPDEGEFSGQTRFLTMRGIFSDSQDLMGRIRVEFFDDLDAVLLMTDGVSDPWLETAAALNSPDAWLSLWTQIAPVFDEPDEKVEQLLLEWLNFRIPGNHDDRTIAILH